MRRILSITIALSLILSTFSIGFAEALKDETVYVSLDHGGDVEDIKVVNRIHGKSDKKYYVDYGDYDYVKPLIDGIDPIIEEDRVKWPTKDLEDRDIYYEGAVDKELPIDIDIEYFLDGKEISPDELAGKSGHFKMNISIESDTNLSTQIQIPLDVDIFSDIRADNGTISVVGKTMTVVFTHMPIFDSKFSLEAKGKDIELDSIMITSTNSKLPFSDELEEFSSEIDKLAEAFDALEDGSNQLNKGTLQLRDGLKELDGGIGNIHTGFNRIGERTDQISTGFNQFNAGFKELKDGMDELVDGVEDLNSRFEDIFGSRDDLEEGISQLEELLRELAEARDQLGEYPEIQEIIGNMLEDIDFDKEQLKRIERMVGELERLYGQISKIDFEEVYSELQSLPANIDRMYHGHTQLTSGLDSLFGGLNSIGGGISELRSNTRLLPDRVGQLAHGQKQLTHGIARLKDEGVGGIEDFLDKFMVEDEDEYKSFVDDRNENTSTCQFIMKTPAIEMKETDDEMVTEEDGRSLLQRILDLFRRK
ncbi:MAG TPA: hypothetical protein GXX70_05910 [Tepidimicrobium sp.]|nr:hypothetical protein [Tepidimicrobium sp.]